MSDRYAAFCQRHPYFSSIGQRDAFRFVHAKRNAESSLDSSKALALVSFGAAEHPDNVAGLDVHMDVLFCQSESIWLLPMSRGPTSTIPVSRGSVQQKRCSQRGANMIDCLIKGGTVVNGTGTSPVQADVEISHGRITSIGRSSQS